MKSYSFTLSNGQDGLLISSFLQKFIREGKYIEAYIQAKQFLPKYKKYLAKRLRQYLPEEIGLANVGIYDCVHTWCNQLIESEDESVLDSLVRKMVYVLSISPKNKWTDLSWIFHKFHPKMKTYPVKPIEACVTLQDYLAHLLNHFDHIKETANVLKQLAYTKENPFLGLIAEAIVKNAQSSSCKGLGCWIFLAAQVCAEKQFNYHPQAISLGELQWDEHIHPVIPDYFYDMHTLKGKRQKRGQVHWFESCCRTNHYVQLASDFQYDPLKYGINVDGIQKKTGIQCSQLVLPQGIVENYPGNYK